MINYQIFVTSLKGTQSGDPTGYLLCCHVIQSILGALQNEFKVDYIDNITISISISSINLDDNLIKKING